MKDKAAVGDFAQAAYAYDLTENVLQGCCWLQVKQPARLVKSGATEAWPVEKSLQHKRVTGRITRTCTTLSGTAVATIRSSSSALQLGSSKSIGPAKLTTQDLSIVQSFTISSPWVFCLSSVG